MADNLGYTPGSGATIRTDETTNGHVQFIKQMDGALDSETAQRVTTGLPSPYDGGAVVRQAPCSIWSVGFAGVGSSLVAPELTQRRAGTGVTVSQSSSNLVIAAGATANSEFLARSTRTFKGSFIQRHKTILSQRIANNNFAVMMADMVGEGLSCTINGATSITVTKPAHGLTAENVGQSMMVGAITGANGVPGRYAIASIPSVDTINFTVAGWPASGSCTVDLFGWNYYWTQYTSTNAGQANVDAQRRGWNSGATTASINTTASPGHVMQLYGDGRNANWSDFLVASSATPGAPTTRASRVENIPDDDLELYFYLWSYNGATNPASSTNWTIGFVSVEEIPNVPAYLSGVRPQGQNAPLPVAFASAQSVSISGTPAGPLSGNQDVAPVPNTAFGLTPYSRIATGDNNLVSVKGTVTTIVSCLVQNVSATAFYLKIYNKNSAPVIASDTPVYRLFVPANGQAELPLGTGARLASGLGIALSRDQADTGATAVAAGDGVINITYT